MADTTNYGWSKPVVGGSDNTWGTLLNAALDDIDTDLKAVADANTAGANLTKMLTVDGPGSGLDADTVDGVQAEKLIKHGGSYTSGTVTVSTSDPSGGSNGDIWLKV